MVVLKRVMARPLWAVVYCFLTVSGCSIERPEGRFPSLEIGNADVGMDTFEPMSGEPEGPLEDATGAWMLLMQDRICILSGVGDPVDNLVWSRYLVQITDSGDGPILQQKVQLCEQTLSPLPFDFITVVPERLTSALPVYDVSGFLVGRELGGDYLTEPFVDLWGAEDVGADDPMPMDAEDERVVDQEGDGEPGVTLTVTSPDGSPICEVQVVQRTRIQFNGNVISARRIEGEVEVVGSKTVLSASSPLCGGGDIGDNLGRRFFKLVRVDGQYDSPSIDTDGDGEVSCMDVRAQYTDVEQYYGLELDRPDVQNCLVEDGENAE